MGWTLAQVRALDADEYEELKQWLNDEADRARHGDDGDVSDADAVTEALQAKARRAAGEG
jgi:hypothetical protein